MLDHLAGVNPSGLPVTDVIGIKPLHSAHVSSPAFRFAKLFLKMFTLSLSNRQTKLNLLKFFMDKLYYNNFLRPCESVVTVRCRALRVLSVFYYKKRKADGK